MSSLHPLRSSARQLREFARHDSSFITPSRRRSFARTRQRHASSTAHPPDKPIVLEQPDKFRPPSHGQRLVKNKRPNTFGSGYNQSSTPREQETQKTKRYPHTFPNEGTVLHRFLTNKLLHVYITLGTLTLLASITLVSTFRATSPFAHLLPPASSLIWHPISFFRECWSVFILDMDYNTAQAFEARNQNIKDAQKRRLYRRAHGAEDGWEYDQGVDVRGIAPWDDGLTERERRNKAADWERKGDVPIAVTTKMLEDKAKQEDEEKMKAMTEEQERQKRKRKVWFGIW